MLLVLSEDHKEHLGFLTQVESSVVSEFGRIAMEFLRKGTNPKIYEGAARKLNVSSETVQHGVEGLTYLLTESSKLMSLRCAFNGLSPMRHQNRFAHLSKVFCRYQPADKRKSAARTCAFCVVASTLCRAWPEEISEIDFQDTVLILGFSEELNTLLLQLYLDNRKEIRGILSELAPKLPSYHSLEWRLDVQLASRSLRQQIKPVVTLKLHLEQNGSQSTKILQTDPSTLLHLIQQLEQALGEMKTNHCRRIVRNIK